MCFFYKEERKNQERQFSDFDLFTTIKARSLINFEMHWQDTKMV